MSRRSPINILISETALVRSLDKAGSIHAGKKSSVSKITLFQRNLLHKRTEYRTNKRQAWSFARRYCEPRSDSKGIRARSEIYRPVLSCFAKKKEKKKKRFSKSSRKGTTRDASDSNSVNKISGPGV